MTRAFRALFVHGVGQQHADFAEEPRQWLRAVCGARDTGLVSASVHWAPLADRAQDAFLAGIKHRGSKGRPLQRLVVGTLADALMYQANKELQAGIHRLLDQAVTRFHGEPFTAFCHSLGGLIFTDWLRQRPHVSGVRLCTLACNIGLFTLGSSFVPVPQLTVPNMWINCFDEQDMLGYPMAVDPSLSYVHDIKVNVGSVLTRWNGLSHTSYWSDRRLWKRTLPKLLAL